MQIILNFDLDTPLEIPLNYNYQLQSAVYAKLREIGASDFWHDSGVGETEKFKFFVFGPLLGNYRIEDKKIIFTDSISFEIRSPFFDFCDDLQRSFELNPTIKLFNRTLFISGASLTNQHINAESVEFKTVSPILVYMKSDSGHMTFLSPGSVEFIDRLHDNFYKKYLAAYGVQPPELKITLLEKGKKVVTQYKDVWLTGYNCKFKVTAPHEALEFIYNCGFGERNSQGFGLIKII